MQEIDFFSGSNLFVWKRTKKKLFSIRNTVVFELKFHKIVHRLYFTLSRDAIAARRQVLKKYCSLFIKGKKNQNTIKVVYAIRPYILSPLYEFYVESLI